MKYTPPKPTKTQLACNAIRDMFFHRQYKGVVPVKDMEVVKNGKQWHSSFTKKAVQEAIKQLAEEEYMNLDAKGENWLWGLPGTHEDLFPNNV